MARRKPLKPQIFNRLTFVSDPQVSPDGSSVVFVVTRPKADKVNRDYIANLWLWRGGKLQQLTHRGGRCGSPRISPRGDLVAFTYKTKEKLSLELLPLEAGEARRLFTFQKGKLQGAFEGLQWSPSGQQLYFLSATKEMKEGDSDLKVVRRQNYKLNDVGFFQDRRKHLYSMGMRSKSPKQITKGDFDLLAFDLSPDGKRVAFSSNVTQEADYTRVRDVHVIPVQGGRSKQVTESKGPILSVRWSPDSEWIAYQGHDLRRRLATNTNLWIVRPDGGEPRNLTEGLDRSMGNHLGSDCRMPAADPSPVWSREGTTLYTLITDHGSCHLYRVPLQGDPKPVTKGDLSVERYSFSRDGGVLAYTAMTDTTLPELFLRLEGGEERLTNFNDRVLGTIGAQPSEPFRFKASDGQTIEGWILRSGRGRRAGVLEIHGGPRTTYGNSFFLEFQLLASRGYDVVYTNPRGSQAYGEEFAAFIVGDYGNRDYLDLMEAADYVVAEGWVDPKRFFVTGGSYGGLMTNWIVGHTDRFRAAVTQRSISNWQSFFGTSDIGYFFGEEEMAALPWEDPEKYAEKSPISYVSEVRTPLLIIHSEEDLRCPMEQAEQFFVALKRLGKEVELARFPEESHELSRSGQPRHRIERLSRILSWFEDHLPVTGD